jgi:hypothetical protein
MIVLYLTALASFPFAAVSGWFLTFGRDGLKREMIRRALNHLRF